MLLRLACLDIPVMARPKKTELKRGNPDFHASSFYVRKTVNHQFNTAIGEMMLKGHEYDRSEVLEALMKQWQPAPTQLPELVMQLGLMLADRFDRFATSDPRSL